MVGFISGRRGGGKSHLADRLATDRGIAAGADVVLIDTLLERDALPLCKLDTVRGAFTVQNSKARLMRVHVDGADLSALASVLESRRPQKPVLLIIEELSWWSKANWIAPGLLSLLRYGRHWNVSLIGLARRAAEISREFTFNCDEFWIFQSHEPNDLRYWSGILAPEYVQTIRRLPEYHHLHFMIDSRIGEVQKA